MTSWRKGIGNTLISLGKRLGGVVQNSAPLSYCGEFDQNPGTSGHIFHFAGDAHSVGGLDAIDSESIIEDSTLKDSHAQVRQLIKKSLEEPTPQEFVDFLDFSSRFRRLAVWNARMVYIQRPGATVIGSEYEWRSVKRSVLPDAVPIIILWPFSPVRFVYELADTAPPIDRESIKDPFAAVGVFKPGSLTTLVSALKKQKHFRVDVESRRQGFSYAGSATSQGVLSLGDADTNSLNQSDTLGSFAGANSRPTESEHNVAIPRYRVTLNDRLLPTERFVTLSHELGHIFCGHFGGCTSDNNKQEESGWPDRRSTGRAAREVEAEAVAFIVASRSGVITRSAEYLKSYAEKADIGEVDVEVVVRAAARVERLAKIHYGTMSFKE